MTLTGFLAQTARIALPYSAAAMAGVWSERSGVPNVALEGTLLVGALGAIVGTTHVGSPWIGLFVALLVAALFQLMHAVTVVYGRANAIVSGIALNLFASGASRFLLRGLYDSSSNSPTVRGLVGASAAQGGSLIVETLRDPLTWALSSCVVLTIVGLPRTAFGLRVRAVGEAPSAVAAAGVSVSGTRVKALAIAGVCAGLGGAWLAFDQRQFVSGMSGGRGFIALAAVVIAGWRPGRAVLFCVLFAAAEAAQFAMQGARILPSQVVQMLPYLATLLALAGLVGKSRPPAALG